jgi:hypothetical protein
LGALHGERNEDVRPKVTSQASTGSDQPHGRDPSDVGYPSDGGGDAQSTSVGDHPTHAAQASASAGRPWWQHPVLAVLALFVVTTAVAAPVIVQQVNRYPQISIYDEASYLDYLYKVHTQGHYIIGEGEKVAPWTTRELACRGVRDAVPRDHRICASPTLPRSTRGDTADIDPPTYTALTDLGARVFLKLGVTHSLLVAGRLVNIVWAGLALTLLMLFCRRLGAGWLATVPVAGIALLSPLDLHQWTYLTPHSLEIAVSVAVVWTAVNWIEGGARWWHMLLAGMIPPLIKATDVLACVLAVVALLCLLALVDRSREWPWRRMVAGAGLVALGCLVGTGGWLIVRAQYSLVTVRHPSIYDAHGFHLTYFTSSFGDFMRSTFPVPVSGIGQLLAILMFGTAGWAVVDRSDIARSRAVLRPLGMAVLVTGACGAWLFVASNFILLDHFVGIPVRYGLAIVPVALTLVAVYMRARSARVMLWVLSLVLLSIAVSPATWYGSYLPAL